MMAIIEGILFILVAWLVVFIILKAVKIMTGEDDAGKS
jgi:TM2 domain-containing membrane protein YozV